MDNVARLPARDRQDLFAGTAAALGIRPAIAEKDFWVCFVLKRLFADSSFGRNFVFKGGTSLSKAYGLIRRFSEDIDLVLDWELLGDQSEFDESCRSKTQQDKFNKQANHRAGEFIARTLCPELNRIFEETGTGISGEVSASDAQVVNMAYPAAFAENYIRPEVRLEIGPLASWTPSANHTIQPYAADVFPAVFTNPACPVLAIAAERTFWEKATILHQEAHRQGAPPPRYSRHYYDLCMMARSSVQDSALAMPELLRDVIEFKRRFYPSQWAHYELAVPGSLRLLPSRAHLSELRRDYAAMQVMLFGEPPGFDAIVATLAELESRINGSLRL